MKVIIEKEDYLKIFKGIDKKIQKKIDEKFTSELTTEFCNNIRLRRYIYLLVKEILLEQLNNKEVAK